MPSWNELVDEIKNQGSTFDIIRRKYIRNLAEVTGRNVIIYYSGWLQKPQMGALAGINDNDKNGFMTAIKGLDRTKGLDLVLHTPGGEAAATESLVDYLRQMFGTDIRAIVPQLAMSAGTMIACACRSIVMGKQASLGPIDPQISGMAAHGIIEEFNKAFEEIQADPKKIPIWQPIIAKYSPTLIGECQKALTWANEMVRSWLLTGMFKDDANRDPKVDKILKVLSDHAFTKSHARHLSMQGCMDIGLIIQQMELEQELQDAILSVHHISLLTLTNTPAYKIIENQEGKAFIQTATFEIVQ